MERIKASRIYVADPIASFVSDNKQKEFFNFFIFFLSFASACNVAFLHREQSCDLKMHGSKTKMIVFEQNKTFL